MVNIFSPRTGGFTIVELLLVIVVLGILSGISVVAYNGATDRARAGAIASGLKTTAEAFEIFAIKENRTTWWSDETITSQTSGHPPIALVIKETNLKKYLPSVPVVQGLNSAEWIYDNDEDVYNGCSASSTGVNIYLTNFGSKNVAQQVDNQIDDGNLSCGVVRYDTNGRLVYNLEKSSTIE